MSKPTETTSDWDEDDNWDDWGDALDDSNSDENSKPNTKSFTEKNTPNSLENEIVDTSVKQEKSNNNNNNAKSWSWGLSSVLATATEGLSNITSTVTKGLDQVIGVPDPEEMARLNALEVAQRQNSMDKNNDTKTEPIDETNTPAGFGLSFVSTLGTKVLNTGLDTLEGIGKKTMVILQENDPLLKNKRKMLGLETDRPNLSEILKEAKSDADRLEKTLEQLNIEKSKELLHFEPLFENYCGLVHLEALELLCKESDLKIQKLLESVSGNALTELKETINEVQELMELEELEGESDGDYDSKQLKQNLLAAIEDVDIKLSFDDICSKWDESLDWISVSSATASEDEIFAKAVTKLAETCALEINKLHKFAELILVKEHHSTANEVDSVAQLCKQFYLHLIGLTNRFATTLEYKTTEEAKTQMSSLFAEMVIGTQHIEKASKLFLPIVQIGAV